MCRGLQPSSQVCSSSFCKISFTLMDQKPKKTIFLGTEINDWLTWYWGCVLIIPNQEKKASEQQDCNAGNRCNFGHHAGDVIMPWVQHFQNHLALLELRGSNLKSCGNQRVRKIRECPKMYIYDSSYFRGCCTVEMDVLFYNVIGHLDKTNL